MVQPLWKTEWRFLKNIKNRTSFDPAISHLGIYPKKMKTRTSRDIRPPMFIAALFTIVKIRRQPRCPLMDGRIKEIHTHTHTHTNSIQP